MRLIAKIMLAFVVLLLGSLVKLPGEGAKDMFVNTVTEYVTRKLGVGVPVMETIAAYVWQAMPWAAAAAVIYLYHLIYSSAVMPKTGYLIREEATNKHTSVGSVILTSISIICLTIFVGYVAAAEWNYKQPAYMSLKYSSLVQLSNSELRGRALSVSDKISDLNSKYLSRRKEIFSAYYAELKAWDKRREEYNSADEKYQSDLAKYNSDSTRYSEWQRFHPFGGVSLGGATFGSIGSSGLGAGGQILSQDQQPDYPVKPTPPASLPEKPQLPIVSVDADWGQKAEALQEEASAIREEINHRLGNYPRFFNAPTIYDSQGNGIGPNATELRELGNDLH